MSLKQLNLQEAQDLKYVHELCFTSLLMLQPLVEAGLFHPEDFKSYESAFESYSSLIQHILDLPTTNEVNAWVQSND